jgi:alpha-tubulin suppressor-like RCC1 family protein
VKALSAGVDFSLALRTDGTIWSWGSNITGQLGNSMVLISDIPSPVLGLSGVIAISSGYSHSMALLSNETVWSWGENISNQLGVDYVPLSITPVSITR